MGPNPYLRKAVGWNIHLKFHWGLEVLCRFHSTGTKFSSKTKLHFLSLILCLCWDSFICEPDAEELLSSNFSVYSQDCNYPEWTNLESFLFEAQSGFLCWVAWVWWGEILLTNGGTQKELCGRLCQFINHTLLQVWHLALVWRVLWLKGLLWLRPTFCIHMEKALALLAIHSWKFPWNPFWWCPLGWIWKLHLGATFLSLWGECGDPRPVLGSLGVPFLSALPALCPLCNVFLTEGRNWRYQNIPQLTLLVSCYNGTIQLGFQPWALEGAQHAAHSFWQSPGFQTLALCLTKNTGQGQGVAVFGLVALPPGSNNFSIWRERALGFYFTYL